jgi:hypothetical protein
MARKGNHALVPHPGLVDSWIVHDIVVDHEPLPFFGDQVDLEESCWPRPLGAIEIGVQSRCSLDLQHIAVLVRCPDACYGHLEMSHHRRVRARLKNGSQTAFGGKRDTDVGTHECLPCAVCDGVDENQLPVLVDADHGVGCCLAEEAIMLLAFTKGLLRALALGDVRHNAACRVDFPVRINQGKFPHDGRMCAIVLERCLFDSIGTAAWTTK